MNRGDPQAALQEFFVTADPALPSDANYDETKVRPCSLPDPLVDADGRAITTADAWFEQRRPEIVELFETHVFGRSPPAEAVAVRVVEEGDALGGRAIRRQMAVSVRERTILNLLVYTPVAPNQAAPAFLGPNFLGNHTVHRDPGILLPDIVFTKGMDVSLPEARATEASRGFHSERWPVEHLLARGYAVATFFYGDVFPDRADGRALGIQPLFDSAARPFTWGALATWAWGMSHALDALSSVPEIDGSRVALVGHSRHGKAALWAGALDARFALVVANNSGKGGASLARRNFGETIRHLVTRYPHWFAARYADYAGREVELPVDQHMLIALIAPRPVYVASAAEDVWADPRGEFLAAQAASPVYRLLGSGGLAADAMPELERPVTSTIGHHLRRGGHGIGAYDWERFLDFADLHLART
jgi:hypothetical protein